MSHSDNSLPPHPLRFLGSTREDIDGGAPPPAPPPIRDGQITLQVSFCVGSKAVSTVYTDVRHSDDS